MVGHNGGAMPGDVAQSWTRYTDGSFSLVADVVPDAERAGGEKDEIEVIASTERVASDGDIIDNERWRLAFYRSLTGGNLGPILTGHRASAGSMIGRARVKRTQTASGWELRAWYQHLPEGTSEAVDNARRLRAAGVRMPVSVRWRGGKIVKASDLAAEHRLYRNKPIKMQTWWGETVERMPRVHQGAELLEISEVVIPSDAGALPVREAQVAARGAVSPEDLAGSLARMLSADESAVRATLDGWLVRMLTEEGAVRDALADIAAAVAQSAPVSIDAQVFGG